MSAQNLYSPLKLLFVLTHRWKVLVTIFIICVVSIGSWWGIKTTFEKTWKIALENEAKRQQALIKSQMGSLGHILKDLKGTFEIRTPLTAQEFSTVFTSTEARKRFTGLQGIGYAPFLLQSAMITQPTVQPGVYAPISMMEPMEPNNLNEIGSDLLTDPYRGKAVLASINSDNLAISNPVLYRAPNGTNGDYYFFMCIPVKAAPGTETLYKDKPLPAGELFAIFLVRDFLENTLGHPSFQNEKINFSIEVPNEIDNNKMVKVYERFPRMNPSYNLSPLPFTTNITMFDKEWVFKYEALPHFFSYERYIPALTGLAMLLFLYLIFYILKATQSYLHLEKTHVDSLSDIALTREIESKKLMFLNKAAVDLSMHTERTDLYTELCAYLSNYYSMKKCLFFRHDARLTELTYTSEFGHEPGLPEHLTFRDGFGTVFDSSIYLNSETDSLSKLSHFPSKLLETLQGLPYWLIVPIFYSDRSTVRILIVLLSDTPIIQSPLDSHALITIISQFGIAYEKALLLKRTEEASYAKTSFLANISHEIRTPLGAIIGFSEMLNEPELPQVKKDSLIQNIKKSGKQLTYLIDDVLDISKIEAGETRIENTQVNLGNLISEIKSVFDLMSVEKGIKFSVEKLGEAPKYLYTDDFRLRQILMNLLTNAFKFTSMGSILLTYRAVKSADPEAQTFVEFLVHDTGPGITEEDQKNLFKPFSQGSSAINKGVKGTGLGLALSRKLANILGGDLTLKETSPAGSTFHLTIPVNVDQRGERLIPAEGKQSKEIQQSLEFNLVDCLKNTRILLAEDSPDNQEIFHHFLTNAGAEVHMVANGQDAIKQGIALDPDIILMDIQLPILDGKSATRALREKGFRKPIVALTAHAFIEEIKSCLDHGCTGHIAKPVSGAQLIQEAYFYSHAGKKRI